MKSPEPLELADVLPAWVIHCPEEPERTRETINHFKNIGMPFQVSYGIHGESFGLRSVLKYGKNEHDLTADYQPIPKHIGIFLSHYMLWNAMKLTGCEAKLIVESDARFSNNWKREIEWALNHGGDYDLLLLGSCYTRVKGEIEKPRIEVTRDALCTHAYVVRDSAIGHLLNEQRQCYTHVDIALSEKSYWKLKTKVVIPRIVEQDRDLPE